jgi:cytochrome oxidase Cu insertion factor (SCO1/SenC/PrrC family)
VKLPLVLAAALAWPAGADPGSAAGEGLLFEPPPPGSYELPPIRHVEDRLLLGPDGARQPLLGLSGGQVAVVSFIYTSCAEAAGCPLASAVLRRLDHELARRPELGSRVRLVSVSFDPARDTPERMGRLARDLAPRSDWRFLTAASDAELAPLLRDFGQDVLALRDAGGAPLGTLQHVLKVFLVDAQGAVRNVYSAGFLSARVLQNDAQTVLAADTAPAP